MTKKIFAPYKDEADCLQIGDLTIENRVDRVSIYGSIDLTLDKEGLTCALQLQTIIDQVLAEMQKADLPDRITLTETETVQNPFA